jgi:uncharacterized protein YkwD
MKRLFVIACILALFITAAIAGINPEKALAAPQITVVDVKAIIGMTGSDLESQYGGADRLEPSEYGFIWHVYKHDYRNYFMAGIRNGQVVAVYSAATTLCYGTDFALNSTRSAVRAASGTPVTYVRSGSTVAILPNTDQQDMFADGDNYVTVFYDSFSDYKVISVMVVPQEDEARVLIAKQPLSASLIAAYQRISVDMVNATRAIKGLSILSTDTLDNNLAIFRSDDMVARDYFSHYTPENKSPADLAKDMGLRFTSLGENIAYGNSNAMLAHATFMNSSGHRSNILKSNYTKIGAGVANSATMYIVLTDIFSNNTAKPSVPDPEEQQDVIIDDSTGQDESSDPGPASSHDLNGDGVISISDYTLVRLSILGIRPLAGSQLIAADVNGDGVISISDYTLMRLDILGIKKII